MDCPGDLASSRQGAGDGPVLRALCQRAVAFLTEYEDVDRIMEHLKLTFVAEKPPPAQVFERVVLMAAEESGDYE